MQMELATDYGLSGKTALVCAGSKGLGRACAMALAQHGARVVLNARGAEALARTADEIAVATGVEVIAVPGDIATVEGRGALIEACPDPDILVNNAGGPPAGSYRDWARDEWISALDGNMIAPILLIRAVIDPMIARGFGRIINITSGAVKAPIGTLGLSNGARAGLTGFVAGLARDVAQYGVTVNNLLPGPFETDRLEQTLAAAANARAIPLEQARQERRAANPSRRFGRPEEFGATCAFLASSHAGYITGQNILMDGGAYPGVF